MEKLLGQNQVNKQENLQQTTKKVEKNTPFRNKT